MQSRAAHIHCNIGDPLCTLLQHMTCVCAHAFQRSPTYRTSKALDLSVTLVVVMYSLPFGWSQDSLRFIGFNEISTSYVIHARPIICCSKWMLWYLLARPRHMRVLPIDVATYLYRCMRSPHIPALQQDGLCCVTTVTCTSTHTWRGCCYWTN